ncbi:MAG TPA: hypothetical protein VEZ47_05740 [Gemmatirosa sp.]|nr:hypothetical protein [Gemmatirosa sp.]
MARAKHQSAPSSSRGRRDGSAPSAYNEARDELFQHIMSCGVIGADPEHQTEWFNDTMAYFTERYAELSAQQLTELRTLGERFAQPPKRQTAASPAA